MEKKLNYWIGKRARLEILKDGKKLYYTAFILECNEEYISFKDKFGETFSFKRKFINQISEINNQGAF